MAMTQQLNQTTRDNLFRRADAAAREAARGFANLAQTLARAASSDELMTSQRQVAQHHVGRLLSLSDDAFESIVSFRAGYQQALRDNDEAAKAAMIEYASEVLGGVSPATISEDELRAEPVWDAAFNRADAERASFFDAYVAAKHKAGLSTQREVADAAGISPTTVQQIEARQVRPQFRTIEKLATAFGVPVGDLMRQ